MLAEQYTKLLRTVSEFNYLTVAECREETDSVSLWVPNGGLYFAVKKDEIEVSISRYLGKKVKIHNSKSLYERLS
jgi:hypothetical protein